MGITKRRTQSSPYKYTIISGFPVSFPFFGHCSTGNQLLFIRRIFYHLFIQQTVLASLVSIDREVNEIQEPKESFFDLQVSVVPQSVRVLHSSFDIFPCFMYSGAMPPALTIFTGKAVTNEYILVLAENATCEGKRKGTQ